MRVKSLAILLAGLVVWAAAACAPQVTLRAPTPQSTIRLTPAAATPGVAATSAGVPTPFPYATLRSSPDATFRVADSTAWQPYSRGIRPGGTITWENYDAKSAHPIECVPAESSAGCPWSGRIELPAATVDANGTVVPTTASFSGFPPGIFIFRDALHPLMRGEIVVGAPARSGSTPAAP
jgi:plastocyanin